MDDRRRLVLARRMATRKRPGPACTACKTRRIKCSKYRPCPRCLAFNIDQCAVERQDNHGNFRLNNTYIDSMDLEIGVKPRTSTVPSKENWCAFSFFSRSYVCPSSVLVVIGELPQLMIEQCYYRFRTGADGSMVGCRCCRQRTERLRTHWTGRNCRGALNRFTSVPYYCKLTRLHCWQEQSFLLSKSSPPAHPASAQHSPWLETKRSSDSCMDWRWEAFEGPGPEDPFREDWKHWGV
jgi:hypothetical protein